MNITLALAQETAVATGKDCGDLGRNRERDFFGGLAADIESRRSVQVSGPGFEIKRSIIAEPRQQLGVTQRVSAQKAVQIGRVNLDR